MSEEVVEVCELCQGKRRVSMSDKSETVWHVACPLCVGYLGVRGVGKPTSTDYEAVAYIVGDKPITTQKKGK